jgi:hypothetical protein
MCPNLLKVHEIPFTGMEPPFVLMVGTMLQGVPLLNVMFVCPNVDVF